MRELETDEIDEMLIRNGVGVLAMVDGDIPYAIPISFGYDVSQPIFPMQWGGGYEGRKTAVIDDNPNVCLTVYEQDTDDDSIWRSVVITGEIYEIDTEDEEKAYASLAANAEFPPDFGIWGVPFEEVEFRLFGLHPEDRTGREFSTEYGGWNT
ncbi:MULTISPECIES: pyridoxamine 5'-phosphate oxidase family protein [Haloarcula]|uniref:pyridoxamine 5'-phosphate oxidase family protein n=1 Tax=Haloarcula TaxID=2237 RepID=UPI0023ECF936|nr:pyridoxamine 5'-phosphate oxidase family protein [Halomicroarcula sp. XH51]